MLCSELAVISRVSAGMLAASRRSQIVSVHTRSTRHHLLMLTDARQDCLMRALANACLYAIREGDNSLSFCCRVTWTMFSLSPYSGLQDEKDPGQIAQLLIRGPRPLGGGVRRCAAAPARKSSELLKPLHQSVDKDGCHLASERWACPYAADPGLPFNRSNTGNRQRLFLNRLGQ